MIEEVHAVGLDLFRLKSVHRVLKEKKLLKLQSQIVKMEKVQDIMPGANLGLRVLKDYRDLLAFIKTFKKIKSKSIQPEPLKTYNNKD